MVTVGDDPLLGVVVEGRYRIESVIGQGSAGTVYKAIQELIGREVAIKVLHDYLVSDQEFIKRFTQEAKASSRLSHPNIITIYDFGVIPKGGRPYIAMDLLRGTPLSDIVAEQNHLPLDEAMPIFKQVCGALGEAHRQGVVHRDVKPENIVLVERSGQRYFPIVVDFGIARLVQEESDVARITRTGTVCGSPTYMSPEQCTSSKVDHRSDIYSLGIVIYETLTGEVPFMSDELVKVMAMHLSDPPKPLNSVRADLQFPAKLEEVVYKALSKNPDQRYQTMDEFADALDESLKAQPADRPPAALAVSQQLNVIQPGPLAASEDIGSAAAAAKRDKEIRESRELTMPPRPKTRDLATRALEELAQRSSGAYEELPEELVKKAQTATAQKLSSTNFQRGRTKKGSPAGGVMGLVRKGVPVVLVLAVLAGIVAFGNNSLVAKFVPWRAPEAQEAEALFEQGKLEEGVRVLQQVKKSGKLSKAHNDLLNQKSISLAKQYAGEKRYKDAIQLLSGVPSKSSQGGQAKSLMTQYTKLMKEAENKPKKK